MNKKTLIFLSATLFSLMYLSCTRSSEVESNNVKTYRGLYVFGPEMKTLTNCRDGVEYWVTDSSSKLELAYSELNFERPYEPVYVEVEGQMMETNALESQDFDSTIVVRKLISISKEVPPGLCID